MKKRQLLLPLFTATFCCLLFAACGGKGNRVPSANNELYHFYFTSVNDGIDDPVSGVISNSFAPDSVQENPLVLITVPESCDLSQLRASYTVDEGVKVYIGDTPLKSGKTKIDYSVGVVTAKVVAENGDACLYDIIVKQGDPYIDAKIYDLMKEHSIPGIAVSVVHDDSIIYNYGYGFADVKAKERVTPRHMFRLASISKQYTAIAIMKLYEDGKLSLDDKVFGPKGILNDEFPGVRGSKAEVTVRNFLQHNSGWISNPDPMFTSPYIDMTLDEQIKYMLSINQEHPVGTKYSYYNLGFATLGKVVEKVSGKSFEEYVREVVAPAGVSDVYVGKDLAGRRSNECVYYSQNGYNGYGNNMEALAAAGGMIASSEEMMKLMIHLDGKGTDILKKETIEEMYTPSEINERYALGWMVGHKRFPCAHYHSGNIAGTASLWCGDTDDGISAVILMNSRSYSRKNSLNFDDAYYILLGDIVAYFGSKY